MLDDFPASGPEKHEFQKHVDTVFSHFSFADNAKWSGTELVKDCHFGFGNSQAETNCDYYLDVRSGVEFIGENDFKDSFPRVELRLLWRLFEVREFEEHWVEKLNTFKAQKNDY